MPQKPGDVLACLPVQSSGRGGAYQELKLICGNSKVLSVSPALAAILVSVKARYLQNHVWGWRMEGRQQVQDSYCLQ